MRHKAVSVAGWGVAVLSLVVLSGSGLWAETSETRPKTSNIYQMVTGEDPEDDRGHWDALFNKSGYIFGKDPAVFLKENIRLLPVGRALDIAMSEGRNAVFLAKKGFEVDGVDYSDVALRKAKLLARENHVQINAINADLNHYRIKPDHYDVIVNINYHQKSLVTQIKRGLKKGGMLVYETWTVDQLKNAGGDKFSRDYLLKRGELKELFRDLKIIHYRETNDGKNALASLIAKKQ